MKNNGQTGNSVLTKHVNAEGETEIHQLVSRVHPTKKSPILPIGKRVVVEVELRAKKTAGGILLPDNIVNPHDRGIVVAAGAKTRHVTIGDRVLLPRMLGENVEIDGKTYAIVLEDSLLGKEEKGVVQ